MPLEKASARDRSSWPLLIGLFLVVAGAGAGAYLRWPLSSDFIVSDATRSLRGPAELPPPAAKRPDTTPTALAVATPTGPTPAGAAAPTVARTETAVVPPEPAAPTFDIVRITPQGNAVVAGRAEPFAHVEVHDGDQVLGAAQADRNGEFVIVPEGRVMPGGRELTLSARGPDGRERVGQDSVVVMVGPPPVEPTTPEATATASPPDGAPPTVTAANEASNAAPIAILLPHDDTAPRILQAPNKPQTLALNSVDYTQQGDIRFSGSAKPSAPVRVYVDNKVVGETSTDHAGQWTLTPPVAMPPGVHQLRVDEIAGGGQVQHRVEMPFQRTITPLAGLSPGQMVVQPGSNLWRIARQTYGTGARYTVIYLANREQIRDPNRIYPGQIFAVPPEQ